MKDGIRIIALRPKVLSKVARIVVEKCMFSSCFNAGYNAYTVEWAGGIQHEKDITVYICEEHKRSYTSKILAGDLDRD